MSKETMSAKVKELRELRRMQEELAGMIEAVQDDHLEACHFLPPGQHCPEAGAAGDRLPLYAPDHFPPVRAGMRKAVTHASR